MLRENKGLNREKVRIVAPH